MSGRDQISAEEFWTSFVAGPAFPQRETVERIIGWSESAGLTSEFKRGEQDALFIPRFPLADGSFSFFLISDLGHTLSR